MRLTKNEHQQILANHSSAEFFSAMQYLQYGWHGGGGGGGGLQYLWLGGREEEGEEEEETDGNVKRNEQPVLFGWGRKWRL